MFARFTQRAQQVILMAQEEAKRLNYPYVGTEHLLLGLIREGSGVAAQAISGVGIELDRQSCGVSRTIRDNAAEYGAAWSKSDSWAASRWLAG